MYIPKIKTLLNVDYFILVICRMLTVLVPCITRNISLILMLCNKHLLQNLHSISLNKTTSLITKTATLQNLRCNITSISRYLVVLLYIFSLWLRRGREDMMKMGSFNKITFHKIT